MSTVIRPEISKKNPYWIPKHRYYELKHFCLQYPEWKKSYASLNGLPTRSSGFSERVSGGDISDPTELYAEARIYYADRMKMVEDAARKAAGDLGNLMLKSVTEGISYEHTYPPCCKEVWFAAYRRFFWLLDKARK